MVFTYHYSPILSASRHLPEARPLKNGICEAEPKQSHQSSYYNEIASLRSQTPYLPYSLSPRAWFEPKDTGYGGGSNQKHWLLRHKGLQLS